MPRQLATIQTIKELLPIDGADNIELVTFENIGWQCVTKKGEFKPGELCVYHEIDSLVPDTNPAYAFLGDRDRVKTIIVEDDKGNDLQVSGYRLRTIRLRKQISQGLALPIKGLLPAKNWKDGDDVSSILGIYKYEKPDPSIANNATKLKPWQTNLLRLPFVGRYFKGIFLPKTTRSFPSFIGRTDEFRVQNYYQEIENSAHLRWYAAIKYDGSSLTVANYKGDIYICSRNLTVEVIKKPKWYSRFLKTYIAKSNKFSETVKKLNLHKTLSDGFAIQGELIGPSIQENPHKLKELDFRPFNVFDINRQKYLNYKDAVDICNQLNLKFVDIFKEFDSLEGLTTQDFLDLADETKLEGLVFRLFKEQKDSRGNRLSFKAISNKYLLKHED